MHMTLLGALLALSPRQLYAHHQGHHGMTALEDQHLGGAVMLLVGGIAYLVGGLGLTVGMVRQKASKAAERP
jgi:putative membrane protein